VACSDPVASQAVHRLIDVSPLAGDPTRVVATLELQCGCTITRTLPEDRIVERGPSGERFAVGKYPCPQGHPVRARQSEA
jgi:hypothetical protein